jgi:4-nitrophenyl phosphatase
LAPLSEQYRAFIVDLDGVIYLLDDPIPGSAGAIHRMQEAGLAFVFLTNNSVATPEMYVDRLKKHGILIVPQQVVTSANAARFYLERNCETAGRTALVIGEEGLLAELEHVGLEVLDAGGSTHADFVMVGWDRHFDFEKLKAAVVAIRNGAEYIAMNTDATYPTPHGLWPGAGTMVAAVSTGAGKEPVVVGKPNPLIVQLALDRMGVSAGESLLIGDRLVSTHCWCSPGSRKRLT